MFTVLTTLIVRTLNILTIRIIQINRMSIGMETIRLEFTEIIRFTRKLLPMSVELMHLSNFECFFNEIYHLLQLAESFRDGYIEIGTLVEQFNRTYSVVYGSALVSMISVALLILSMRWLKIAWAFIIFGQGLLLAGMVACLLSIR